MLNKLFNTVVLVTMLFAGTALAANEYITEFDFRNAKPLPLPKYSEPIGEITSDNGLVVYDPVTGTETLLEPSPDVLGESDFVGGFTGSAPSKYDPEENYWGIIENFGSMERVSDPASYPWRVNCKIYISYPGDNIWYHGSAVLIDQWHALTAGHCVYDHDLGGWADMIVIIPAYLDDSTAPYGMALDQRIGSWSKWVNNRNFKWDMGVIWLNCYIGRYTGWFGYGYNNSNSFFKSPTHHNASYPAQGRYSPGDRMYYRYGDFDNVTTHKLKFDRWVWGGMSGSGAYKKVDGDRIVYSVCSYRDSRDRTVHCRINSDKFYDIRNWINSHYSREYPNESLPAETSIIYNYPNPFNATTTISYDLPSAGDVNLEIYNLAGQKVATLVDGYMDSGQHTVNWNASLAGQASYSSGVYFYRLTTGGEVFTKRMTLLK
jgi:glutamyl endopeptidase